MIFEIMDYILIGLYFAISLAIGLYAGRRSGKGQKDYFLAGGSTPWLLAGTSMVATTFAADTPLAVTGLVRGGGIAANWIWWSFAAGGVLTVFFFARLWRRSGLTTDLEFLELRYGGPQAAFLRGAKALYLGVVLNLLIIGWVNLAMLKIIRVLFPTAPAELWLIGIAGLTALYVMFAGLRGVVAADAFQFIIAMGGSILLAFYADQARPAGETWQSSTLSFWPDIQAADGVALLFTGLLVQWWAAFYPGAEPGGGGYVAQRILASRSERDGLLAALWFNVAHYALRPWPWILTALAAMLLYPAVVPADYESSYVFLMRDVLPSPARGLLVAAFLGAYMSTISTQLNWGASYFIHDFYQRFVLPGQKEKHYVLAGRLATVGLFFLSLFVTFYILSSIEEAWKMMLEAGAGSGLVLMLRWYWWRINARTELVSLLVPALGVLILRAGIPALNQVFSLTIPAPGFPYGFLMITGAGVFCSVLTALLTAPEDSRRLQVFFDRIRPPGPGWKPFGREKGLGQMAIGWLGGILLVYGLLFLLGSLFLGKGYGWWLLMTAAGILLARLGISNEKEKD